MAQKIRLENIGNGDQLLSIGFISAQVSQDDMWEILKHFKSVLGIEIVDQDQMQKLIGQIELTINNKNVVIPVKTTTNNNDTGYTGSSIPTETLLTLNKNLNHS